LDVIDHESISDAQPASPSAVASRLSALVSDIVPIGLISLALAFAATLYPSWRASRVNPAQALRYE
jgi:ABC-type lipoprotein release transport system permease subunit